jgi:hypothetical protein
VEYVFIDCKTCHWFWLGIWFEGGGFNVLGIEIGEGDGMRLHLLTGLLYAKIKQGALGWYNLSQAQPNSKLIQEAETTGVAYCCIPH